MESIIKVNGRMVKKMVKEECIKLMDYIRKVIGKKMNYMAKDY